MKLVGTRRPVRLDKNASADGGPPQHLDQDKLSGVLSQDREVLARLLGFGVSFDVLMQDLDLDGRRALIVTIDGFFKDDVLLRISQFLISMSASTAIEDSLRLIKERGVVYGETQLTGEIEQIVNAVLAGQAALLVDGYTQALLIDERVYPARSPEEPDTEQVVGGARDGFVETLIHNVTLVRRRLRDPKLRFEVFQVGKRSKTDVVIAYIEGLTNPKWVDLVKERIQKIDVDAVNMATRGVEEFIVPKKRWWNPFPTVRYSERPDVVVPHLLEGHVVIMADNMPRVMILPVTFFHHLQNAQEYMEEPVTGAFVRWIRFTGLIIAWFGPALWLGLSLSKDWLGPGFSWIGPREAGTVPLGLQMVLAELSALLVLIALIHTPTTLATSLGLIGTLLLGEQAVKIGLFSGEVLFYVAAAFVGTFATPSLELANAIRVMRLLLITVTAIGKLPGFIIGSIATVALMASTGSFGVSYLYPLWPFHGRDLINSLFRRPLPARHLRPAFTEPIDKTSRRNSRPQPE